METFCKVIFMIAAVAIVIDIVILIIGNINDMILDKKEMKLKEYEININAVISEDLYGMLDRLINESFMEYIVLNVEYKDIDYVTSKLEEEINKEVAFLVADKISPAMVSKLSLIYNMNNFHDILARKVYLCVLNYVLEKNNPNKHIVKK